MTAITGCSLEVKVDAVHVILNPRTGDNWLEETIDKILLTIISSTQQLICIQN